MELRTLLVCSVAALSFSSTVFAQCNNVTTGPAVATAGYSGVMEADCAQLTISVGGVSFSTPAKCKIGYAYYYASIYHCNVAMNNMHCDPNAFWVAVVLGNGGRCPNIAGLVNGASYSSWAEVPSAVQAALNCVPPKHQSHWEQSANVTACATGKSALFDVGSSGTNAAGETFIVAPSTVQSLVAGPTLNPFSTPFESAQTGGYMMLPDPLRGGIESSGSIEAVRVVADLTVEHFDENGVSEFQSEKRVSGLLLGDGRLDMSATSAVDGRVLEERLIYTGNALLHVPAGAPTANAFSSSYAKFGAVTEVIAYEIKSLYGWLVDPYEVVTFPESTYAVLSATSGGTATVARTLVRSSGTLVAEAFTVEPGLFPPRVVSASQYDESGFPRVVLSFANHRDIGSGTWRPFTVSKTIYLDGALSQRRMVTTVTVRRATVATAAEFQVPTFHEDSIFLLWN